MAHRERKQLSSTTRLQTPGSRLPTVLSEWRHSLSPTGNKGDAIFRLLMFCAALLILLVAGGMIIALAVKSLPAIHQFGLSFLITQQWNPVKSEFGALPFIYGTVVSSAIALLIGVPLSLGIAVLLVEQAPRYLAR